jgi:hypothetical protein
MVLSLNPGEMCADFSAYRLEPSSTPQIKLLECEEYKTLTPQLRVHVMLLAPSAVTLIIT